VNRSIFVKVLFSMLFGILTSALLSEATFGFFRRSQDRDPEIVVLTIPAGTAAKVASGDNPPSIPKDMTFVVGDTLQVVNQDAVNHQLGPLFIPAGAKASLSFDAIQDYVYTCSFRADNYLGLTVQEPLTIYTRVIGILSAGIPMGIMIALYVIFAATPKKKPGIAV
jgi:hypothetical protein